MKTNLLLVGPLPKGSTTGGAITSFNNLYQFFKGEDDFEIYCIDTNFKSNLILIRIFISVIKYAIYCFKSDVIMINMSPKSMLRFGVALFYLSPNKNIHIRFFGSNIDQYIEQINNNKLIQYFLKNTSVHLQCQGLREKFELMFPDKEFHLLPTSRVRPPSITNFQKKENGIIKFVFTGRIIKEKGIYDIIKATDILNSSGYINKYRVDLYGSNCNNSREYGINVSYKGEFDSLKFGNILMNYDVLLLPTYYNGEGYPGSIVEAYLSGLPVITSNWKYIPEM